MAGVTGVGGAVTAMRGSGWRRIGSSTSRVGSLAILATGSSALTLGAAIKGLADLGAPGSITRLLSAGSRGRRTGGRVAVSLTEPLPLRAPSVIVAGSEVAALKTNWLAMVAVPMSRNHFICCCLGIQMNSRRGYRNDP